MATSRRNFLKTGSLSLLGAAIPVVAAKVVAGHSGVAKALSSLVMTAALPSQETFARYLNTNFRVKNGARSFSLKLTSVIDHKAASKTPSKIAGKECFSLLFNRTGKVGALPQETYLLEHAELGSFRLFLVPVGKPESKLHEAVIVQV